VPPAFDDLNDHDDLDDDLEIELLLAQLRAGGRPGGSGVPATRRLNYGATGSVGALLAAMPPPAARVRAPVSAFGPGGPGGFGAEVGVPLGITGRELVAFGLGAALVALVLWWWRRTSGGTPPGGW